MKKRYEEFSFDLQLFAENEGNEKASDAGTDNADKNVNDDEKEKTEFGEEKGKGYTEKDLEIIKKDMTLKQKEAIDKAVADALKEQKRLSALSEEERQKEETIAKEKNLSEREKAIEFKEKLAEVKDELLERKLPLVFAELFVSEDSAKALEKIKDFDNSFKKAVQDAVDAKIKGVSMKASVNNLTSDGKSLAMIKNAEREVTIDPWAKK